MSIRKTFAIAAVAASLFASGVPAHADEYDPDSATEQKHNDGENGYHFVTMFVTDTINNVTLKVAGGCEFTTVGYPNENKTEVVVVGHATTTAHEEHGPVTSTGIDCRVYNGNGPAAEIHRSLPGTNVADVNHVKTGYGNFTVCTSVSVHLFDNYFAKSKEKCVTPE